MKANASKHKALSYKHAREIEAHQPSEGLLRRIPWNFMEILSMLAVAFIILARRKPVSDIDMFAPPVFMMLIRVFAFDNGGISRVLGSIVAASNYRFEINGTP